MQISLIQKCLNERIPDYAFNHTASQYPFVWKSKIINTIRKLVPQCYPSIIEVTNVQVGGEHKLHREHIHCKIADCITMQAILLRPFGDGVFPFILICPGRNAKIERLTGLTPFEFEGENISEILSKKGFATLTVDYGLVGAIDSAILNGRDELDLLSLAGSLLQLSPLALVLNDLMSCLSWVERQEWYTHSGVGIFGRSIGGFIATYFAIIYEKTRCVALSNCLCSYPSLFEVSFQASSVAAIPGILIYADFPDLVSAIAPTPLHLQLSINDPIYSYSEGKKVVEQVQSAFDCFNCSNNLDISCTNRYHGTDTDRVVDFFLSKYIIKHTGI